MRLLQSFLLVGLGTFLLNLFLEAADQPNVVILFADDSGYADVGFQESAR